MMYKNVIKGGETMTTVLFVCTGNTCRSPMAHVLFQEVLGEAASRFEVLSAGTHADDGDAAARSAVEVMADCGLDLQSHRSTRLTQALVERADLLLTMTAAHKQFVLEVHPEAKSKTFTLKQFVGMQGDVEDPFGAGTAAYESVAAELRRLLTMAAEKILHRSGTDSAQV